MTLCQKSRPGFDRETWREVGLRYKTDSFLFQNRYNTDRNHYLARSGNNDRIQFLAPSDNTDRIHYLAPSDDIDRIHYIAPSDNTDRIHYI